MTDHLQKIREALEADYQWNWLGEEEDVSGYMRNFRVKREAAISSLAALEKDFAEPTEAMRAAGLMAFVEHVVKWQEENPIDATKWTGEELERYKAHRMGSTMHNCAEITAAFKAMISAAQRGE